MLRKSRPVYDELWTERARPDTAAEPKDDADSQRLNYWDAIVTAVETNEFSELMQLAREAGRYQAVMGLDLADVVARTVSATNLNGGKSRMPRQTGPTRSVEIGGSVGGRAS